MKLSPFWLAVVPGCLGVAFLANSEVAHGAPYWAFTVLGICLLAAIRWRPHSWFYTFTAVFFVLGCWLKLSVHHYFNYPYAEPTGAFSGMDHEWADYYALASTLGLALLTARVMVIAFGREDDARALGMLSKRAVTGLQWSGLVLVALLFYALNNLAGFFITGVEAKVNLPFGLNAPFAFMALIGFAVVVSIFLARDVSSRQALDSRALLAVLTIASIASVSMASRAAIVMQAMPMLIAATYVQLYRQRKPFSLRPFVFFSVFLTAVLVVVSIYRITLFSGSSTNNTELVGFYALESVLLIFDRWIGAEALMVAVSEPTKAIGLTFQLLQENAAIGNDAIYQLLAGSRYEFLQGLVFLTLPGYFAVIGLSGSLVFSFFATLTMALLGALYERFVSSLLYRQDVAVAVISAALANALAQLSFPRLLVPFVFQMTALVVLLHFWLKPAPGHACGRTELKI